MAELAAALLPFGPKDSASAVERIRRIARGSVPFAATIAASDPDLQKQISAGTNGTWESPEPGAQRKRAVALGVTGLLLVGALLASVFALGRRSADRPAAGDAGQGRSPVTAASGPTPPQLAQPEAASAAVARGEPVAPVPAPVAPSSSVAAVAARPPSKAGPSVQRGACPKGQTLSNGHCCPNGLVWQKGGCDRPLAVSLP
jgi:hypothetical protein